jgi:hypothetical protein
MAITTIITLLLLGDRCPGQTLPPERVNDRKLTPTSGA